MPDVLVFAESRAGSVRKVAFELLTAARALGAGGEVHAVLAGAPGYLQSPDKLLKNRQSLSRKTGLERAIKPFYQMSHMMVFVTPRPRRNLASPTYPLPAKLRIANGVKKSCDVQAGFLPLHWIVVLGI